MIFVKIEKLLQEILLSHEFLCCEPPIILKLLRIVFLWSFFTLAITKDANGMKYRADTHGWMLEHLDLINMRRLDRVQSG